MKLIELNEGQFEYEVGDTVKTPFGPGVIKKFVEKTEKDMYYLVLVDEEGRKKHDLDNKPIRMGSFELKGIIKKA